MTVIDKFLEEIENRNIFLFSKLETANEEEKKCIEQEINKLNVAKKVAIELKKDELKYSHPYKSTAVLVEETVKKAYPNSLDCKEIIIAIRFFNKIEVNRETVFAALSRGVKKGNFERIKKGRYVYHYRSPIGELYKPEKGN